MKAAHGDEDEDEDEDDEEQEEALRAAAIVPRTESTLAKHAMDGFNKGLEILEATPGSSFAQESIRATQEMEEYGVMVDIQLNNGNKHKKKKNTTTTITTNNSKNNR